jgi:spoIIIJ-associated protein
MSKFLKSLEKSAKNVNDAVQSALSQMSADMEDVTVEVIDEGSKGFLGLGVKEARVRVDLKNPPVFVAKKFLTDIFRQMNMDVAIDAKLDADKLLINLTGENMGIVIGRRGDTLDSIQYLTSLIVNHESEEYIRVEIDTENYREKRTEALLALSDRLAQKVERTGKKYTLEPMNPYERRVIHANLQENQAVTTYSVGEEPYRKVVIAPQGASSYQRRPRRYSGTGTNEKKEQ